MRSKIFVTHGAIVKHISQKFNLEPDRVDHTIRLFLGFRGIGRHMKTGHKFYVIGFGLFRPNSKRRQMMKRKVLINKFKNRMKRKKTISRF